MSGAELIKHLRRREEMLQACAPKVVPNVFADAADRWIMASLLQKAIRRGQCELALGASSKLLEIDPSRLWRRLMTIALEDVGVGDLDVALDLVAISSSSLARKILGGAQRSLEIVIPVACRATKDRTADHLGSLARWDKIRENPGDREMLFPSVPADCWDATLSSTECNSASFSENHIYGAIALAGAWQRGKLKLEEALDHFGRRGVPLALLEACSCYGRRCGDALFLYALAAWALWKDQNPEPLALVRHGLKGRDLGGLPDYALDPLHTRLGRRAIELWLRSYLGKLPFEGRQVMAGLWNAEAALSNQVLFWATGGQIQKIAYQADLLAEGLTTERHDELVAWIAEEHSVLVAARQLVWRSHVKSSREAEQAQARLGAGRAMVGAGQTDAIQVARLLPGRSRAIVTMPPAVLAVLMGSLSIAARAKA
jgi:hypothetical protein